MSVKAWLNWETLFLVMFPVVAKLAGNKQNVLLPLWLNEKTLFPKTKVNYNMYYLIQTSNCGLVIFSTLLCNL